MYRYVQIFHRLGRSQREDDVLITEFGSLGLPNSVQPITCTEEQEGGTLLRPPKTDVPTDRYKGDDKGSVRLFTFAQGVGDGHQKDTVLGTEEQRSSIQDKYHTDVRQELNMILRPEVWVPKSMRLPYSIDRRFGPTSMHLHSMSG